MNNHYPHIPGYRAGSPETSCLAAESVKDCARSIEAKALAVVSASGERGMTSDEIADALDMPNHYAARPRVSGLKGRKEIVDSGRRRRNASGRSAAVWVLPEFAPAEGGDL